MSEATDLIRVLDALDALPSAVALRARSYELLAGRAPVVDVGCGAGRAVAELAERGVKAVGLDLGEQLVAVARSRWPEAEFQVGDACALPFGDGELGGYRAEKVLHDLPDPARAVAEARRVLAPGGRIVLLGQDWDTLVVDSDEPDLTRIIVHARADAVTSPRAARRHRALLLDAGFADVTVEVHTMVFTDPAMLPSVVQAAGVAQAAGAVGRDEADAWTAEQAERARTGRFFLAMPIFVAAATRP